MNLAKALTTKSRYAHKIASLELDIKKYNSTPADQEKKINVNKMMEELKKAVHNIVRLKLIIFTASEPMRENILELAEAKSRIAFLRDIDTHEGKGKTNDYARSAYYDAETAFEAAFDIVWVRTEITKCEEKIDKLQDELDVFNHNTQIEFNSHGS